MNIKLHIFNIKGRKYFLFKEGKKLGKYFYQHTSTFYMSFIHVYITIPFLPFTKWETSFFTPSGVYV